MSDHTSYRGSPQKVLAYTEVIKSHNHYYHQKLRSLFSNIIPQGTHVVEIGCGGGDLLASVNPDPGVGMDYVKEAIDIAKTRHPNLSFIYLDQEALALDDYPEYIILADVLGVLWDIQQVLEEIRSKVDPRTKLIISSHNYWWEPILRLAEWLGIKQRQVRSNWLTIKDIENLLHLADFEIIKAERKVLCPIYIPILSWFLNVVIINLPIFNRLGLINMISARPIESMVQERTVSIIIPARNEKGNIEQAIIRTPSFGLHQEFIFIEGHSKDGTYQEMKRVQEAYAEHDIKIMRQSGNGKGNAVREAFAAANGDVLMILDADLTTPPEDLPKFYHALTRNKGEFINGCRLVYPMEKQAMRFLNFVANKFFGVLFSYLLGQPLKDTLCGTKVLYRKDYLKIAANRHYFGDFDPFGDFDLLFGAAKLNLKIVEVIVRYRDRSYGSTQISRFRHGWLLLRMSFFAARKIKFIS